MEETDKQLAEILKKGLETAEKTGDFVVQQAPELIKQLLLWKTIEYAISIIIGISLLIVFYRWTQNIKKKMAELGEDAEEYILDDISNMFTAIFYLFLFICGITIIATNIQPFLQIVFAPKLFLIEYAVNILR